MILILNKIFPNDISQYIFEIIKKDYFKKKCINKFYILDLMINNMLNKYSYQKQYNILYDLSNIKKIHELIKYITIHDKILINNIEDNIQHYNNLLKFHNIYQNFAIKKIIINYII